MSRWMLLVSLVAVVAGQSSVFAFCSSGNPDEILCEDFDTYCAPGEYPGGAGVTKGAQCAPSSALTGADANLRVVWPATSKCGPVDTSTIPPTPTGQPEPQLHLDNAQLLYGNPYYYAKSRPYGSRSPSGSEKTVGDPLPQHTFKDWSTGELNISRFVSNKFGNQYKAVMGTDQDPLVLTFMLDSLEDGKILFSNGFIELGFGDPSDYLNRANTDYALTPDCAQACNGNPLRSVRFPVICDIWNPDSNIRFVGCPNPTEILPPKRNAVAIGLLPMVNVGDPDKGPCYCGSSMAHGGQNSHPQFFNGQVWFELRNSMPVSGATHTVTDMNGNPATVPLMENGQPNHALFYPVTKQFVLWHAPLTGPTGSATPASGQPYNWITLTIKSTTCKIKLYKIVTTISEPVTQYQVTDELDNIPLAYSGPFDSIRLGVGPGCRLASNSSWECSGGRSCVTPMGVQGQFAEFDDISLQFGKGWSPVGACCLSPSGTCLDEQFPADCIAAGGTHKGGATSCSDPGIFCCPIPYADADNDLDVDSDDFAALQVCYSGTQIVTGQCSCFDRNGDKKVDQMDVVLFANCATGPGITLPGDCP